MERIYHSNLQTPKYTTFLNGLKIYGRRDSKETKVGYFSVNYDQLIILNDLALSSRYAPQYVLNLICIDFSRELIPKADLQNNLIPSETPANMVTT